jgi:hypothetical protein
MPTAGFETTTPANERLQTRTLERAATGFGNIYKTKIVPFILYGSQTWSLAFRGEYGLKVFVKRVLRKMSGIMGETNKHVDRENGPVRNSYICSAHKIRRPSN